MGSIILPPSDCRSRRSFYCMILVLFVSLCTMLLFCDIKYEVSDDFVMQCIASGAFDGIRSPYIMFSNIIWGALLTVLYSLLPVVNWYFWMQITLCFLAFCSVSYLLSRQFSPSLAAFLCAALWLFFARDLFLLPQFTKTASVCITSGSLLFLWSLTAKHSNGSAVAGAVLALVGSLIRFQSIFIAAPFVFFFFLYRLYCSASNKDTFKDTFRHTLKKLLISCSLLLLSVIACRLLDTIAYQYSPDYQYFKEYSSVRSKIIDYPLPSFESCADELSNIPISENDYELLVSWSFADDTVYSLDTMKQILSIVDAHRSSSFSLSSVIDEIRSKGCLHYPAAICCILLGFLCILFSPRLIWIPLLSATTVFSLLAYFITIGRCIYRVEFGFFFGAAVFISLCMKTTNSPLPVRLLTIFRQKKVAALLSLSAILTLTASQLSSYLPDQSYEQLSDEEYRDYVDSTFFYSWAYGADKYTKTINQRSIHPDFWEEVSSHPENLYLLDFNTTIQTLYYDFSPFTSLKEGKLRNTIYLGGVTVNHPAICHALDAWQIETPIPGLLQEHVYLVSNTTSDQILTYLQEHYDSHVTKSLYGIYSGYSIWSYSLDSASMYP